MFQQYQPQPQHPQLQWAPMNQPIFTAPLSPVGPPAQQLYIPPAPQVTVASWDQVASPVAPVATGFGPAAQYAAPSPVHSMFADMMSNPAYTPTAAPKKEKNSHFRRVSRMAFDVGLFWIRPISHPTLLPKGYHFYSKHIIEKTPGASRWGVSEQERNEGCVEVLCTESYAPDRACYMCSLIADLDRYGYLKEEVIGPRLFGYLHKQSTAYIRNVIIPMLVRGKMGIKKVTGQDGQTREYDVIWPHDDVIDVSLWLKPDHPEKTADKSFLDKLMVLGMTPEQVQYRYTMLSQQDQMAGQRFYNEVQNKIRNPNFHDVQWGNWIQYDKQKKGQHLTIVSQAPEPLPQELVAKYWADKVYPNMLEWGIHDSDFGPSKALTWFEQQQLIQQVSWWGRELDQIHGYDLNLDPREFEKVPF